MSIDKFVPLSPDPDLNVGADMTLARFGHLNKLVDEINANGSGGGGGIIVEGEAPNSTIRCGVDNQAFGNYGSALGAFNNITCNDFTANTWGRGNIAHGCYSSVSGTSNIVCARNSHILSGTNNTIACDATQGACNTQSSYSGNYFRAQDIPIAGGISVGCVSGSLDLTSVWTAGSTFSTTYSYAYGITGTGSCCYGQFQMANVPVICSTFNECGDNVTRLYFCYDPTLPNFIGNYPSCYTNGGGCCVTFSCGYLQKTGTFSSYSTYGAGYHPNVIAGGAFNVINDYTSGSTISGGYQNTMSGGYGVIAGGQYHYSDRGAILGGSGNTALYWSSVGGGFSNRACGTRGFIGSGDANTIGCVVSYWSFIGNGQYNCINSTGISTYTSILNGCCNYVCSSDYSSILGGRTNCITNACVSAIVTGDSSCIVGGCGNTISGSYTNKIIGGGCHSAIISGFGNTIDTGGNSSFATVCYGNNIIGGGNTICGLYGNMTIGQSNIIPVGYIFTNILGTSITADRCCTTFVNNLSIKDIPSSNAGLPSKSVWFDATTCTLKMVP